MRCRVVLFSKSRYFVSHQPESDVNAIRTLKERGMTVANFKCIFTSSLLKFHILNTNRYICLLEYLYVPRKWFILNAIRNTPKIICLHPVNCVSFLVRHKWFLIDTIHFKIIHRYLISLYTRSMWETICDAGPSLGLENFWLVLPRILMKIWSGLWTLTYELPRITTPTPQIKTLVRVWDFEF